MKLNKSHIENIRRAAKNQGITPTSAQIRSAADECYPGVEATEFDTALIPDVVDILLAQKPSQSPARNGAITLSDSEKYSLAADAAQEAGLDLVADEIKILANAIRSGFDTREELLNEVMNAIVTYAEERIDNHSASLISAANRIRSKVNAGNKNARSAFASINEALEVTNNDFKSELKGKGVAELFSTAQWN